jgi:prepilin-type N-terminal cleavage/methylation domain-containing protein
VSRIVRSEHGVTLVELLLAMVVVGTIVAAVAGGVVVGLRTTHATQDRVTHSHDRQMASAYFVNDVQSARTVSYEIGPTLDLIGSLCTVNVPGPTFAISFAWDDGATKKLAAYLLQPVAGEPRQQMKRLYCENGSLRSTVMVAHSLIDESRGTAARVRCPPAPSCSSQPSTVTMTLTDANGDLYQLAASRRTTA